MIKSEGSNHQAKRARKTYESDHKDTKKHSEFLETSKDCLKKATQDVKNNQRKEKTVNLRFYFLLTMLASRCCCYVVILVAQDDKVYLLQNKPKRSILHLPIE